MNLVLKLKDITHNNIYFMELVKNTVMDNSDFIRINYSNSLFITNGIHLEFILNRVMLERYYSKYKCIYKLINNIPIIDELTKLENKILLSYIKTFSKEKYYKINYKLKEQLYSGSIKILSNGNINCNSSLGNKYILKISGVWDTGNEIGLTYKFLYN